MTAGQHTATITLTLPSGSTTVQSAQFTIPESALSLSLDQTAYTAGGSISPVISNTGGVDTTVQYTLDLFDSKAALISWGSNSQIVPAGSTATPSLAIPIGAVDGSYSIIANYKDESTGKTEIVSMPLTIAGIKAGLSAQTDKPSYLTTENITSYGAITNTGTALQNGNLHLQVTAAGDSQKSKTWASQNDFQEGVRNGVDTYGMNDWLIPNDDFDKTSLDSNKWSSWGNVSIQSGKLYINDATTASGAKSLWQLDGDFDIQVDFDSNNSALDEGPEFALYASTYWVFVKNMSSGGYSSGININGSRVASAGAGSYVSSGRLRITRMGSNIATYYWNGSGWTQMLSRTYSQFADKPSVQLWIWRGQGYSANAKFDNFKINSGRIVTKNETVDSVRLLPANDNYDPGVLNMDRWEKLDLWGNNSGSFVTQNGKLYIKVNNGLYGENVETKNWSYLLNDFDIQVDWSEFSTNATGDTGPELAIVADAGQFSGNFAMIKRMHNSSGEFYLRGIKVNDVMANTDEVPTSDTSGKLRIARTGSQLSTYYHDGTNWVMLGNVANFTAEPVRPLMKVWMGSNGNASAGFDNFTARNTKYASSGTWRAKYDGGQQSHWENITFNTTTPLGTSIKLRTRSSDTDAGLSIATWSDYITASGSAITSPKAVGSRSKLLWRQQTR